jgi:hypothetical protein
MKNATLYIVFILICFNGFSQSGMGNASSGASEMSSFKTANLNYNIDPFGTVDKEGTMRGIRYTEISGTPFLDEEWKEATIYDVQWKKIGKAKVRYNINTDQLHFLDLKDQELVADKSIIGKVTIQQQDNPSVIETTLIKGYIDNKKTLKQEQFVSLLNEGSIQLLKQYFSPVVQKDSLFGTIKINKFSPYSIYYIKSQNSIVQLGQLDLNEISNLLPNKPVLMAYQKKKRKIKSEKDFIDLLNFYNAGKLEQ